MRGGVVVVALGRGPRGVDDERCEHDKRDRRTAAPVVGSRRLRESFRVPTDHGQVCGHVAAEYRETGFAPQAARRRTRAETPAARRASHRSAGYELASVLALART